VLIGVDQFRSVICLILQVVEHTFLDYLLNFWYSKIGETAMTMFLIKLIINLSRVMNG